MATDFNYANTITAATPAVAAEVQDNFDDVLTWIKAYYQQTLDTTTEIAAAIAANPVYPQVLGHVYLNNIQTLIAGTTDSVDPVDGLIVEYDTVAGHTYKHEISGLFAANVSNASTTASFFAILDFRTGETGGTVMYQTLINVPGAVNGYAYSYTIAPVVFYETPGAGSWPAAGTNIMRAKWSLALADAGSTAILNWDSSGSSSNWNWTVTDLGPDAPGDTDYLFPAGYP